MEGVVVLEKLIEKKLLNLIKTFLSEPHKEFYLQELSEKSKVPVASAYRILNKLIDLEIITERKISRFTIYKLSESKETAFLHKLFKFEIDPLSEFISEITAKYAISAVYLQGAKSPEKANLVILAYDLKSDELENVAKEIKVKYNFTIHFMLLTPDQFKQMESMGLSNKKNELLFSC